MVALFGSWAQVMVDAMVIDRTHAYHADRLWTLPSMDSSSQHWSMLPQSTREPTSLSPSSSQTMVPDEMVKKAVAFEQSMSASSAQAAAHISRSLGG
jgi:hypothetical protein